MAALAILILPLPSVVTSGRVVVCRRTASDWLATAAPARRKVVKVFIMKV